MSKNENEKPTPKMTQVAFLIGEVENLREQLYRLQTTETAERIADALDRIADQLTLSTETGREFLDKLDAIRGA